MKGLVRAVPVTAFRFVIPLLYRGTINVPESPYWFQNLRLVNIQLCSVKYQLHRQLILQYVYSM